MYVQFLQLSDAPQQATKATTELLRNTSPTGVSSYCATPCAQHAGWYLHKLTR